MDSDEKDLVKLCLDRDQEACTRFVQVYGRMVGTVIWRAVLDPDVVDDLTQETFFRAFRALPYFDARAKLSTWLYTIAHHVAIDFLRKAGRCREEPLTDHEAADLQPSGPFPGDRDVDPETVLARREYDRLVHDALAELPDKYRLALVYGAIDELGYGEIAEMLGVPVGTVKTLIFRGKKMLRQRIAAAMHGGKAGGKSCAV